jgi:hypothetical protein
MSNIPEHMYEIKFDSQNFYVIAEDFHEAIDKWKKYTKDPVDGEEYEPESVALFEGEVVR